MKIMKINVTCLRLVNQMLNLGEGDNKEMRRLDRVLDCLEEQLKINKEYLDEFYSEEKSITIIDQLADDIPVVELILEDADFDFFRKKHNEFKFYKATFRKAVLRIDEYFEKAETKKISITKFKDKDEKEKLIKKEKKANG